MPALKAEKKHDCHARNNFRYAVKQPWIDEAIGFAPSVVFHRKSHDPENCLKQETHCAHDGCEENPLVLASDELGLSHLPESTAHTPARSCMPGGQEHFVIPLDDRLLRYKKKTKGGKTTTHFMPMTTYPIPRTTITVAIISPFTLYTWLVVAVKACVR